MRRFFPALFFCFLWLPWFSIDCKSEGRGGGTRISTEKTNNKGGIEKVRSLIFQARKSLDTVPDKVYPLILSALRIAVEEQNYNMKAEAYIALSEFNSRKRRFLLAQQHYLAAVNNYRFAGNSAGIIEVFLQIGMINRMLANYESALEFFNLARDSAFKCNNIDLEGQSLQNLAIVYQLNKDPESAESFYQKALMCFQKVGNDLSAMEVRNNIGSILIDQSRYRDGLFYYKNLLSLYPNVDENGRTLGIIYTRIGHCYAMLNKHDSSLFFNLKALRFRKINGFQLDFNSSLINVAGDYFNLGLFDSAMLYMNQGMDLAKKYDQLYLIQNGYRHLYQYYEKKGDYKTGLRYYGLYSNIYEGLLTEKNLNHIRILEAQQELKKNIEEGKRLRQQNLIKILILSRQKNQFYIVQVLAVVSGVILSVITVIYIINRRNRKQMQIIHRKLEAEILERSHKERQTRNADELFRFLSENSIDFITHFNNNMERIYASPACRKLFGYEPEEMLKISTKQIIHPEFLSYVDNRIKEMIEARSARLFTYKIIRKDGESVWVESMVSPLFETKSGLYIGMIAVVRDIHERKTKEVEIMEATNQKENLLKEIHHRVKNNFAILVSLINMQLTQENDPGLAKTLTSLQLRIRSMALVHEMLYRSQDFEKISFPDYLRSLASVISGTFNRRDIALDIQAEEAVMNIDSAIPMGLIVNELLSNVYMHAFPDGRKGKITLDFRHVPENGHQCLMIKDDGIGMPSGFSIDQVNTMGLQIVQLLSRQIEGKLVICNDPGACFSITFQIPGS